MTQTTPHPTRYDHNGECLGCGAGRLPTVAGAADGEDYWCTSTCGFKVGQVTLSMVLRAAAGRLDRFPLGRGTDLWSAFASSAAELLPVGRTPCAGEERGVEDLVVAARDVLGAYFDSVLETSVPGVELIDDYAVRAPRRTVAATLYLAAALDEGAEAEVLYREHLIGRALRELEDYWPDADRVFVGVSGSPKAPTFEFLGVMDPDDLYQQFGWLDWAEEQSFNNAGALIVAALQVSLPTYLTTMSDGVTCQFPVAKTVYGKTLRQ